MKTIGRRTILFKILKYANTGNLINKGFTIQNALKNDKEILFPLRMWVVIKAKNLESENLC